MLTGDSREFFLRTVCDTRKDGCATGEGHVSIQVAMEVEVALEDGIRDDSDQVDRAWLSHDHSFLGLDNPR
jgi:hypothetical protein